MKIKTTYYIGFIFNVILTSCSNGSYELPRAAGVIDVTQSPFNADNSGKTDCSEALQKAFDYAVNKTKGIYTDGESYANCLFSKRAIIFMNTRRNSKTSVYFDLLFV